VPDTVADGRVAVTSGVKVTEPDKVFGDETVPREAVNDADGEGDLVGVGDQEALDKLRVGEGD
jgi:hypothetical protein